jgi:hypothetical protein
MPRIPGVNHLDAVRALKKAGFEIIRQGTPPLGSANISTPWRLV